jgi:hypothetical protein
VFTALRAALAASLFLASATASAFSLYTYGTNEALKWGASNTIGTPGGTIYWSLVPDGTPVVANGLGITGTSDLTGVFGQLGPGFTYVDALPIIERVFARWSAAGDLTIRPWSENPLSGGSIFDEGRNLFDPTSGDGTIAEIRISAFSLGCGNGSCPGAVGYAPPPNGGVVEGDIVFNTDNLFQIAPGDEGDLIDFFLPPTFFFYNDFEGLLQHEAGHALGLDHPDVCAVMSVDFDCYKFVNRELDADDIAGFQALYGVAAVPAPPAAWRLLTGVGSLLLRRYRTGR